MYYLKENNVRLEFAFDNKEAAFKAAAMRGLDRIYFMQNGAEHFELLSKDSKSGASAETEPIQEMECAGSDSGESRGSDAESGESTAPRATEDDESEEVAKASSAESKQEKPRLLRVIAPNARVWSEPRQSSKCLGLAGKNLEFYESGVAGKFVFCKEAGGYIHIKFLEEVVK